MTYGLKEYKELLEKNLAELRDQMNVPFGTDPFSNQAIAIRMAKSESINYAIEMLPEIKEPMKDHVFREQVNTLHNIAIDFTGTGQLRARLAAFLELFKEKVE